MTIPKPQWETMLALALAHGHAWAYWASGKDRQWQEGLDAPPDAVGEIPLHPIPPPSWDEVSSLWAAHNDRYGIHHPVRPVGVGWGHTTATGRTSWTVDVDGRVIIEISRPMGVAIRCEVAPDRTTSTRTTGLVFGERHIDALYTCLAALCGEEHADGVCAELRCAPGYDDVREVT